MKTMKFILFQSPATSTVSTKFVVNETESISPSRSMQGKNEMIANEFDEKKSSYHTFKI